MMMQQVETLRVDKRHKEWLKARAAQQARRFNVCFCVFLAEIETTEGKVQ
jgi:hypothetical protein